MKEKTAVEWLENNLYKANIPAIILVDMLELIKQAKAMEKEQMKRCYAYAVDASVDTGHGESFEEYYNKTYNK